MIPTTYVSYEFPEYKNYEVPNKVVDYIEYLEKQEPYLLKRRIDKAIEYIEKNKYRETNEYNDTNEQIVVEAKHLLEILKGEDND